MRNEWLLPVEPPHLPPVLSSAPNKSTSSSPLLLAPPLWSLEVGGSFLVSHISSPPHSSTLLPGPTSSHLLHGFQDPALKLKLSSAFIGSRRVDHHKWDTQSFTPEPSSSHCKAGNFPHASHLASAHPIPALVSFPPAIKSPSPLIPGHATLHHYPYTVSASHPCLLPPRPLLARLFCPLQTLLLPLYGSSLLCLASSLPPRPLCDPLSFPSSLPDLAFGPSLFSPGLYRVLVFLTSAEASIPANMGPLQNVAQASLFGTTPSSKLTPEDTNLALVAPPPVIARASQSGALTACSSSVTISTPISRANLNQPFTPWLFLPFSLSTPLPSSLDPYLTVGLSSLSPPPLSLSSPFPPNPPPFLQPSPSLLLLSNLLLLSSTIHSLPPSLCLSSWSQLIPVLNHPPPLPHPSNPCPLSSLSDFSSFTQDPLLSSPLSVDSQWVEDLDLAQGNVTQVLNVWVRYKGLQKCFHDFLKQDSRSGSKVSGRGRRQIANMLILAWNIWGLGHQTKKDAVCDFCKHLRSSILALSETKLPSPDLNHI
ncbi:hypothetical protein AMTRI_Chr08g166030 [Amborella trichopoda]